MKSDDGDDDEGEEDGERDDGERNAGVKYAASIIIESAPSTPKVESREEGPTRRTNEPTRRREKRGEAVREEGMVCEISARKKE